MESDSNKTNSSSGLSRRRFIELGGLGGLSWAWSRELIAEEIDDFGVRYNDPLQPLIFRVERAWDLLHLDVELINFMPVRTRGTRPPVEGRPGGFRDDFSLHIASYATDGFVVLHLGGQHIAEQAIWDRPIQKDGKTDAADGKKFPTYFIERAGSPKEKKDSGSDDIDFLGRDRRFVLGEDGTRKLPLRDPQMLQGLSGAWMAGHSQLVFRVPQYVTPLPLDFDDIIEACLRSGQLVVHDRVLADGPDETFFTGSDPESIRLGRPYLGHHDTLYPRTQIEFPSMLYISPYDNAEWNARGGALGRKRTELWSLDLAPPVPGAGTGGRPREQRAQGHLFAFDADTTVPRWPLEGDYKFDENSRKLKYNQGERPKTSLYQATRELLVGQMGEDNGDIVAQKFRLSALGASAKLKYRPLIVPDLRKPTADVTHDKRKEVDPKDKDQKIGPRLRDGRAENLIVDTKGKRPGFLTEWDQRTESGRDYFVKEAFAGYWFPFQLPGESVTVTERMFCAIDPRTNAEIPKSLQESRKQEQVGEVEGNLVAFLVARKFGVVKQRVREFGGPESSDFDDAGAMIARALGLRKIEILVDETPTLSNQGTPSGDEGAIRRRIIAGDDGIFITGGTGKDAAREIFWPRVAVADRTTKAQEQKEQNVTKRQLTPYLFPVRLTFIDGRTLEARMPMMFCWDLSLGGGLYPVSPQKLRTVPIHANMPLAVAQSSAAMNQEDLGVEDAETLRDHLKGFGFSPSAKPEDAQLRSLQLTSITSALVGGIRERTLNYVAEQRGTIEDKIEKFQIDAKNLLKSFEVIHGLIGSERIREKELARQLCALVAWGKDGHVGVTAAQAGKRLGDAVELAVKAEKVVELITRLNTVNTVEISAENAKGRIVDVIESLKDATANNIRDKLPNLQAQWVASLGDIWHRSEWDEWFAGLFIAIDSTCWVGPATSLVQRDLLTQLMKKGEASGIFEAAKIPPLADWTKDLKLCRIPEEVAFDKQFESLRREILAGKQTALRRLKKAVEEALPDELWLRQRVQMMVEDWALAERTGKDGIVGLGKELEGLLEEVGLHLSHLATHSDAGIAPARRFYREVAENVEDVAEQLASAEKKVQEWAKINSDKFLSGVPDFKFPEPIDPVDTIKIPEVLKHVLQCDPDQSLRHFQNLLHECGGRLAVQIEEALLELVDVAVAKFEEVNGIAEQIKLWGPETDLVLQAQYRRLARKARERQEELLGEIRRVILPWRGTLENLQATAGERIPSVIAGRICLWLEEILPDRSLSKSAQSEINERLAAIEKDLANEWAVERSEVQEAINLLERHLGRFEEETKQQIVSFRSRVEGASASAIYQVDGVERYLVTVLSKGRTKAQAEIRSLLKRIGADVAGSVKGALENQWKEMRPHLAKIQAKLGQSLDDEAIKKLSEKLEGEFKGEKAEIEKALDNALTTLNVEIKSRKELLEGAALHLANKASISLGCPSVIKSFRDQSAKAEYFVEEIRFTVKSLGNTADRLAGDVRTTLGFPGVETLRAKLPNAPGAHFIQHTNDYVRNGLRGLEKEVGGTFAEIASNAKTLAQKSGVSDAVAQVKYLSRDLGSIAKSVRDREAAVREVWKGVADAAKKSEEELKKAQETFNNTLGSLKQSASSFLPGGDSKLFGVIPLKDILKVVATPDKAPQLLANHLPDRIEENYVWENELKEKELKKIVHFKPVGSVSKFRIVNTMTVWTPKPGQPRRIPEVFTRGHLDGFVLGIAGMLNLHFKSVAFTAKNGQFDFKPSLGRTKKNEGGGGGGENQDDGDGFMTFTGPLELVDTVRKKLSTFLDSKDGPVIRVEKDRIFAGYSFSLPEMTFGAVSIQNLSIGAQLSLPLNKGSLAMRFNLSEFDNQFRVTVLCFAGGGFLAVQVSPDRKLCSVEGSIEFGGSLALNLGVASGELSLMAGAYFKMEHDATTFSGYLRAVGRVRVLGIIEISILFYMALFYRRIGSGSEGGTEFWGQCTVAVSIKLGFFKKTVRMTLERKFKGSDSKSNANELKSAAFSTGSQKFDHIAFLDSTALAEGPPTPSSEPDSKKGAKVSSLNHFEHEFEDKNEWAGYWEAFAVQSNV